MKKNICTLVLSICCLCVFSQAMQSDELPSVLFYSDIPLKEGVEVFEEKLNNIRKTENREPLGLVLCGGSARAFAHIGVLKALEENGITPDFIVANSMGAIIGQLYSYGFSLDTISQIIDKIDLTTYFDPVIPIHGGVINTRKFRSLIYEFLGQENVNLSEGEIPILVITEDLISKRQVWHCSGDFATIMTAAFAMPAIMETVSFNLTENDQREVCLTDSGTIDIAGISVAENFSSNIVVSTAFYDKKINLNNFIVVLNRIMTVGKERQTVKDIKKYQPLIIRNEVENYSFMEFDKVLELEEIGYKSTVNVIDSIKMLPHGYKDLSEKRKLTQEFVNQVIYKLDNRIPLTKTENYFGGKLRFTFANIDYPDFSLYETDGVLLMVFGETKHFYGKAGVVLPFLSGTPTPELFLRFNPSKNVDIMLFSAYGDDFFAGSKLSINKLFFTVEYQADKKIVSKDILFTSGGKIALGQEKNNYLEFKPFGFISGEKFVNLSYGIGCQSNLQFNPKSFGISNDFSIRYAFDAGVTKLYKSDYFRDKKTTDSNNLVFSNGVEVFYINKNPQISFAELFIIKEFKIGGFFDLSHVDDYEFCTGGFGSVNLSFIGLCDFVLESGAGYNLSNKNLFGYFTLKNRI